MRILLVEQDLEHAHSLRRHLRRAGYVVERIGVASEALRRIRMAPPDRLILDLDLPDRRGYGLLHAVRSENSDLPVMILLDHTDWQGRVDGFREGTDDYVSKPIEPELVVSRLSDLTQRRRERCSATLEFRGLRLDDATRTARLADGRKILLSHTEYRLARYFLLYPLRTHSNVKLATHVSDLAAGGENENATHVEQL